MPHRRASRGYSLVELLVAISLIVLLIALLLPALGKSRVAAQTAACSSNLRQQGIALAMYNGDFSGYFINPWHAEQATVLSADGRTRHTPWMVQIHPYLPAPFATWTDIDGESATGLGGMHRNNAWSCPQGRPGWSGFPGWGTGAPTGTTAAGGNYTLNAYLYQFEPIDTGTAGTSTLYSLVWQIAYHTGLKHERKAQHPATTLATLDGYVNYNNFSGGTYTIQAYAPAWTTAYDDNIAYRSNRLYPYHNRAQNHLFLDGHAKALPVDRFLVGDTVWNSEYLRMAKGLRASGL